MTTTVPYSVNPVGNSGLKVGFLTARRDETGSTFNQADVKHPCERGSLLIPSVIDPTNGNRGHEI